MQPSKYLNNTAQKLKFFIKDFLSKCDQIRSILRIWSHLLKKSLTDNFIFYATHKENRRLKIEVATKMDDCFAICQYKIYEPKNNEISTAISKSKIANL